MEEPRWYGVRTVYEHTEQGRGRERLYEERIVLIRAANDDEAIAKAEEEARAYAVGGIEYLEYAMTFWMFEPPAEGQEVFSLLRDSRLEPQRYVDVFFDTGRERSR